MRLSPALIPRIPISTASPLTFVHRSNAMPTFDGGHCFLTALIPIETTDVDDRGGWKSSHVQMVREALAVLPTAHQSAVTETLHCNSPFAKCTKTHFARLVVLDDVI